MSSDNPSGADNQQETARSMLELDPRWIAGFVDGEGCFSVSVHRNPSARSTGGWQLHPVFHVYQHARLARDIRQGEVHLSIEQKGDVWELAVVTRDKPLLFSNICGTLSAFGMDILRGSAMTSPNGVVLDIFQFSDGQGAFRLFTGLATVVASIVAGVLWQAVGPAAVFAFGAGMAVAGLAALVVLRPVPRTAAV